MSQQTHQTPPEWGNISGESSHPEVIVIISADMEWQVVREILPGAELQPTPYGECFALRVGAPTSGLDVNFLHGGWGKIAAAASAEFAIQRWHPDLLVNIGTCGGFDGHIQKGEIILAERTVVYDIIEQMGDFDAHIQHYATELDLAWLGAELPSPARRGMLASADRDLFYDEIPNLIAKYGAIAGDWESGAIAWVAARHQVPCLILRGVSDVVGGQGSPAYGDMGYFEIGARQIMENLLTVLPDWLAKFHKKHSKNLR